MIMKSFLKMNLKLCVQKVKRHHSFIVNLTSTSPKTIYHIPRVRPIVSGSGSIVENLSKFVDFYLKDLANKHKSYIQDTPDFIRQVEKLNAKEKLPESARRDMSLHQYTTRGRHQLGRKSPQSKGEYESPK